MKKLISFFSAGFYLLPSLAFAVQGYEPVPDNIINTPLDIVKKIDEIGNWMFTILLVLAVIFIVLAAYKYLMSGGGEEVSKAHKMLAYAAVAVAVAFLARGIVAVVKNLVGGPAPTTSDNSNTSTSSTGAKNAANNKPILFKPLEMITEKSVSVEICADNIEPGVQLSGPNRNISNFMNNEGTEMLTGGSAKIPGVGAEANAGSFVLVADIPRALDIIGLAHSYQFKVEICNNGRVPILIVDGQRYQSPLNQ